MLKIEVPGYKTLNIEYLVLDFNGTVAKDGKIINGVKDKLDKLSKNIQIHILTSDTFGTVQEQFSDNKINIEIIDSEVGSIDYKKEFIKKLNKEKVIAIGNGNNDSKMLKTAELGITIIGEEGAAISSIWNSEVAVNNIIDALNLIIKPKSLIATLRR
ncbi:MAG TPA: HAD hydrolase family protein [Halanaerobiales bacterium]|nr:HAD hydrolase family protein [Halanaerobiales bacterium]